MKVSAQRLENRRNQLLEAATVVFARKGFHDTRIADIAREAGVAYGLVYHYFKNKDEILGSLFEGNWGLFLQSIDYIRENKQGFRPKMDAIAGVLFDAYRAAPERVSVLIFEVVRSKKALDSPQLETFQEMYKKVGEIIVEGQSTGEVRKDIDPHLVACVFFGAIEIVLTGLVMGTIPEASKSLGTAQEQVLDLFVSGVGG